jgi:hypothetical protein
MLYIEKDFDSQGKKFPHIPSSRRFLHFGRAHSIKFRKDPADMGEQEGGGEKFTRLFPILPDLLKNIFCVNFPCIN